MRPAAASRAEAECPRSSRALGAAGTLSASRGSAPRTWWRLSAPPDPHAHTPRLLARAGHLDDERGHGPVPGTHPGGHEDPGCPETGGAPPRSSPKDRPVESWRESVRIRRSGALAGRRVENRLAPLLEASGRSQRVAVCCARLCPSAMADGETRHGDLRRVRQGRRLRCCSFEDLRAIRSSPRR